MVGGSHEAARTWNAKCYAHLVDVPSRLQIIRDATDQSLPSNLNDTLTLAL